MELKADLYLEGSDQHRGWFQTSLLESCGIYDESPYKSVLTHGFVIDENGKKCPNHWEMLFRQKM